MAQKKLHLTLVILFCSIFYSSLAMGAACFDKIEGKIFFILIEPDKEMNGFELETFLNTKEEELKLRIAQYGNEKISLKEFSFTDERIRWRDPNCFPDFQEARVLMGTYPRNSINKENLEIINVIIPIGNKNLDGNDKIKNKDGDIISYYYFYPISGNSLKNILESNKKIFYALTSTALGTRYYYWKGYKSEARHYFEVADTKLDDFRKTKGPLGPKIERLKSYIENMLTILPPNEVKNEVKDMSKNPRYKIKKNPKINDIDPNN